MKTKYVVKRLAEMALNDERRREIPDIGLRADVPCLVTTPEVSSPMGKREAQRVAEEIADADGNADIFDANTGQLVATVRWGGLCLPDRRNEKGERLFFDPENCFWTGVSRT